MEQGLSAITLYCAPAAGPAAAACAMEPEPVRSGAGRGGRPFAGRCEPRARRAGAGVRGQEEEEEEGRKDACPASEPCLQPAGRARGSVPCVSPATQRLAPAGPINVVLGQGSAAGRRRQLGRCPRGSGRPRGSLLGFIPIPAAVPSSSGSQRPGFPSYSSLPTVLFCHLLPKHPRFSISVGTRW